MNFKEMIQTDSNSARIEFKYRGNPETGMLAWLDSSELMHWWKAESAVVEPFHGGMFYLSWGEHSITSQHAIYGVVEKVDIPNNVIEVSKIMYISPAGKMGHLHMHIRFEQIGEETKMTLVHTHSYSGRSLLLYNAAVYSSWPQTFGLLKKHLEQQEPAPWEAKNISA